MSITLPANNSTLGGEAGKMDDQPGGLLGWQIALIVIGAVLAVILLIFLGYMCYRRYRKKPYEDLPLDGGNSKRTAAVSKPTSPHAMA